MKTIAAILGLIIILFILVEVFEALVLPRRVLRPYRFTRLYYQSIWRAWSAASRIFSTGHNRQSFLSLFGPLSLLILFGIWAFALIMGFGFTHYGFSQHGSLDDAMYLSGTTFTTLGYGDMTPSTQAARILSVAEAATGFGFFAVVIAYLPVLYQAFSRREAFIALFDARAGSPPAAGRMILRRQTHYGIALFTLLALAASFSCFVLYGRAALYLPTIAWWVVPAIFYYPRRWSRAPSAASHPEGLLKRLIDVIRSSGFNRTRTE
jgi:voltage-gated potassium channel Kch